MRAPKSSKFEGDSTPGSARAHTRTHTHTHTYSRICSHEHTDTHTHTPAGGASKCLLKRSVQIRRSSYVLPRLMRTGLLRTQPHTHTHTHNTAEAALDGQLSLDAPTRAFSCAVLLSDFLTMTRTDDCLQPADDLSPDHLVDFIHYIGRCRPPLLLCTGSSAQACCAHTHTHAHTHHRGGSTRRPAQFGRSYKSFKVVRYYSSTSRQELMTVFSQRTTSPPDHLVDFMHILAAAVRLYYMSRQCTEEGKKTIRERVWPSAMAHATFTLVHVCRQLCFVCLPNARINFRPYFGLESIAASSLPVNLLERFAAKKMYRRTDRPFATFLFSPPCLLPTINWGHARRRITPYKNNRD